MLEGFEGLSLQMSVGERQSESHSCTSASGCWSDDDTATSNPVCPSINPPSMHTQLRVCTHMCAGMHTHALDSCQRARAANMSVHRQ